MELIGLLKIAVLKSEVSTLAKKYTNFNSTLLRRHGLLPLLGLIAMNLKMTHARFTRNYTSLKTLVAHGSSLRNMSMILLGA
jgi:hypothetical protein